MHSAKILRILKHVNFEWPDPALYIDPEECRRLVDEAPDDKVVMGMLWACHFQDTCAAFGMENCLMNMISDPEMVHYVDDRIVDFYVKALKIFLEATKGKVQAILIGNDMGSQRGLMISPKLVKEFVIPGAKKLVEVAHSYGVKVVYHSCGFYCGSNPASDRSRCGYHPSDPGTGSRHGSAEPER